MADPLKLHLPRAVEPIWPDCIVTGLFSIVGGSGPDNAIALSRDERELIVRTSCKKVLVYDLALRRVTKYDEFPDACGAWRTHPSPQQQWEQEQQRDGGALNKYLHDVACGTVIVCAIRGLWMARVVVRTPDGAFLELCGGDSVMYRASRSAKPKPLHMAKRLDDSHGFARAHTSGALYVAFGAQPTEVLVPCGSCNTLHLRSSLPVRATALAVSDDEQTLFAGTYDGTLSAFDLVSQTSRTLVAFPWRIMSIMPVRSGLVVVSTEMVDVRLATMTAKRAAFFAYHIQFSSSTAASAAVTRRLATIVLR